MEAAANSQIDKFKYAQYLSQYMVYSGELRGTHQDLLTYTADQKTRNATFSDTMISNVHRARMRYLQQAAELKRQRQVKDLYKATVLLVAVIGIFAAAQLTGAITASAMMLASSVVMIMFIIYFTVFAIRRFSNTDAYLHGLGPGAVSVTKKGKDEGNSSSGSCPTQDGYVVIYEGCNYGGRSITLTPGRYDMQDIVNMGLSNDAASSIKVFGGATAVLFKERAFRGASVTITQDVSCFNCTGQPWCGFNDSLSSIVVA